MQCCCCTVKGGHRHQARAQLFVPEFRIGFFERGERVGILAVGALSGFVVPALWVLSVGSTVTVVQRFRRRS